MHIHFVQHETFEAPGAYLSWAKERGHTITFSKVYEHQALPDAIDHIDLLIVMGGPQSPETTIAECPHFDGPAEMALINRCINADKKVIGVCLGAQLIGAALGARVERSPEREIGVFPITLTNAGKENKNISHFGDLLKVGHWHGDMPGLTAEALVLATSEGCPRQIVAFSDRVYGFQCHMELTKEVAALLIEAEEDLADQSRKHQFIQHPDEILDYDYTEMNDKLYQFLDLLTTRP